MKGTETEQQSLVPQSAAITFPGDTLGKEEEPWGLYHLLGLEGGESKEEVRKRARELRGQYHPDRESGDRSAFKTIGQIRDILLDETGLTDFSSKEHYDRWSEAAEVFENPREDIEGLTEKVLEKQEKQRREAELKQNIQRIDRVKGTDYYEKFEEIEEQMQNSQSFEQMIEANIERELLLAEAFDADLEENELRESVEEFYQERQDTTRSFLQDMKDSYTRRKYGDRLWDITSYGDISFIDDGRPEVRAVDAEEDGDLIHITTADGTKLATPENIHCKVPEGDVRIEDPDLEGTVQVREGDVEVEIDKDLLDTLPVVQARAPEVEVGHGYEHAEGEIYVPSGHEAAEPDLNIMVLDGTVTLSEQDQLDNLYSSEGYNDLDKTTNNYLDGIDKDLDSSYKI